MYNFPTLSASSLLRAHIRQDVSLVFVTHEKTNALFQDFRKYIYALVAMIGFCGFLPSSGYAATNDIEKDFIITAYYSPLPNQSFYLKGDYEAEKKLNGNGTNGASGIEVFTGMLAAPKTYGFGTRIDLQGLGVGIVEDRGGAIVVAGERGQSYDRIDVWMGYGEPGLRRAMIWGRRKVHGTIITDTSRHLLSFLDIDSGKIDLSQYEKITLTSSGTLSSQVIVMFADLGYILDGRTVKDMITDFQLDHGIIKSASDSGAGNYGPLTQAKLSIEHDHYSLLRDAELQKIEREKAVLISQKSEWEATYLSASQKIAFFGGLKKGQKGSEVRELQTLLKKVGYFRGKESGTMSIGTVSAIRSLQKANGILASGVIDGVTRDILIEEMIRMRG